MQYPLPHAPSNQPLLSHGRAAALLRPHPLFRRLQPPSAHFSQWHPELVQRGPAGVPVQLCKPRRGQQPAERPVRLLSQRLHERAVPALRVDACALSALLPATESIQLGDGHPLRDAPTQHSRLDSQCQARARWQVTPPPLPRHLRAGRKFAFCAPPPESFGPCRWRLPV